MLVLFSQEMAYLLDVKTSIVSFVASICLGKVLFWVVMHVQWPNSLLVIAMPTNLTLVVTVFIIGDGRAVNGAISCAE